MSLIEPKKIVVSNSGDNSITIIDLENNFKTSKINYCDMINENNKNKIDCNIYNSRTHSIFKGSESNIMYTINPYTNNIFKIDIDKKEILDLVYVGSSPSHIEIYNRCIYVTNSDSNSISVIEEENFDLIETIAVGEKPHDLKIDKLRKKLFVANSNEYSISIIDLVKDDIEKIFLDINPLHLHILNQNMFILSCGSYGEMKSSISLFNLEDKKVFRKIFIEETLLDMVVIKDLNIVFTTNGGDGFLYKIDYITQKIIDKIYIGGMPNDILWDNNSILYISDSTKDCLFLFDIYKNQIVRKIPVGKEPNGLIFI